MYSTTLIGAATPHVTCKALWERRGGEAAVGGKQIRPHACHVQGVVGAEGEGEGGGGGAEVGGRQLGGRGK